MFNKKYKDEIWKDVVGYEGLYKVSNFGRVYSLHKNKIKTPQIDKDGYERVGLAKNKKCFKTFFHRIVAIAFIPNPNNYEIINHKDQSPNKKLGIHVNNNVDNLEWCNYKYNNNYKNCNKMKSESLKNRKDLSKKIIQYDLNKNFIKEYESQKEAERITNIKQDRISYACNSKNHFANGFFWYFKL